MGGGGGGGCGGLATVNVSDGGESPTGAFAAAPSAEEAPNLFSPGGTRVDSASFDILYMIGQGGFGKVFQVKRKTTGKIYAMKCMRKDCVLRENLRGTKAERSILSSLKHPFIVNMHWAFQCRSRLYIVMDYFPGTESPLLVFYRVSVTRMRFGICRPCIHASIHASIRPSVRPSVDRSIDRSIHLSIYPRFDRQIFDQGTRCVDSFLDKPDARRLNVDKFRLSVSRWSISRHAAASLSI